MADNPPARRRLPGLMATTSSPRTTSVRRSTAEQLAPVLRAHADIQEVCAPMVDVAAAHRRIAGGQVAYEALGVVRSCGDLSAQFARVLESFEVAGLVSNADRVALLDGDVDVDDLVCGWFRGDRAPSAARRRIARMGAIVIGNAVLRAATARVGTSSRWASWSRVICPACGGAPDIALIERSQRFLVCSCCDAQWRSPQSGCLGCDAVDSPTGIARIGNPALGYDLMMCNSCGRFLKERPRRGLGSLLVERTITAELDVAAEQRGLRI